MWTTPCTYTLYPDPAPLPARYLILDEGHKVKNEDSLISGGMRKISRQHVMMLTGTPVQNNLHELFALLNFMYPDVFTDSSRYVGGGRGEDGGA